MDFAMLVLVTAILIIRPTDFISTLEAFPLYEVAISTCILFSFGKLLDRISNKSLRECPIAVSMLGILVIGPASDLANGDMEKALNFAIEYAKVVLYFLLLVGIVDTPSRLRRFLGWLVIISLVPTILAILHYHGIIQIPAFTALESSDSLAFDADGRPQKIRRLIATGVFADPNDFCEILNLAILLSLSRVIDFRRNPPALCWLAPIAVLGYALVLTQSRGGLLGIVAGLMALFLVRFGRRKALKLGLLALPLLLLAFKGRMTSIGTGAGTGQLRIQYWAEGFVLLRHSPFLGIGANRFTDLVHKAAHNSFICAYTELGLLGGSLYFGMYYYAVTTLRQLGSSWFGDRDPGFTCVHSSIMAAVASYAVSEMSLTHPYTVSTYVVLGLATACIRLDPEHPLTEGRLELGVFPRVLKASALFVVALFTYVQFSLRWG